MNLVKRVPLIAIAVAAGGLMTGCFSYHREVKETTTPAVAGEPAVNSSTTTTTTSDDGGRTVERRSTTTYGAP